MAFDGIVVANLVKDMRDTLLEGRISKIAQPENDELLFTIKTQNKGQVRLLVSASASLPLLYFTETNKPSPLTAPNFCMLLRKHIGSGRITDISQPAMERIVDISIEHLNELGDLCKKHLMIELMGKHSNIIFCDDDGKIIDSIKHVSAHMSSVREVLPGRDYFIPETIKKCNPFTITEEEFMTEIAARPVPAAKSLYGGLTGFSPVMAEEVCHLASIDSAMPINVLTDDEKLHVYRTFRYLMEDVASGNFTPNIVYRMEEPVEFSALPLTCMDGLIRKEFASISEVLETYYASKNVITRIRQKSADLRRVVTTALERNTKKYELQLKQLKDTDKREKYRIYGELINTYGYTLESGAKNLTCENYYDGKEITIPLDETLTPLENSQKYFDRYGKLKRTYEALIDLTKKTHDEIEHLESISAALDIALKEEDLAEIKLELQEYGYIKKHAQKGKRKEKITSKPFHYLSSDGFHMYVGKNNYQNEELTFKFASGNDWWFHAKGVPGSHVIVKSEGKELPDKTFEEAAALAAYYSKGKDAEKVEIDYIEKKHVKKTPGGAPGFVIYHTNYSMMATPKIPVKEIN